MSQATAIEALARGSVAASPGAVPSGQAATYLGVARQARRLFTEAPPSGVAVPTPAGTRYLQYTFAPGADQQVLNRFLQALIGLNEYARITADPVAARLFAAGDAEPRLEVPAFDTGAWSLYQPGQLDSLDYHQLATGFLAQLCARTFEPVYCGTARRFTAYVHIPPAVSLMTRRLSARRPGTVVFRPSKPARVGIVLTRGARAVLATSASFAGGLGAFAVPSLPRAGQVAVRLAATDPGGKVGRVSGSLQVVR